MSSRDVSMKNITDLMDHYRDVARLIWNFGFRAVPELQNWDSRDRFEEIKKLLFRSLVVERLDGWEPGHEISAETEQALHVVPSSADSTPIMIHHPRERDRNRYWDDPVNRIRATDAELHFLDYFDWDDMASADFQYYRVRIGSFPAQPHLAGREALLEHKDATVFFAGWQKGDGGA
jgi:hypothetical protein